MSRLRGAGVSAHSARRWPVRCALVLGLGSAAEPLRAEQAIARGGPTARGRDAPLLPPELARLPVDCWLVGVAAERSFSGGHPGRAGDDLRVGLGVAYRRQAWGPHLRALVAPNGEGYESFSGMLGGGLRAHFAALGIGLSIGVGAHAELRLRDHLWLAYASPLELGASILERGSLRVRLMLGVRRVFAGDLINIFLVDPNGFESNDARAALRTLESEHPWQSFLLLDVSRTL